MKSRKLKSVINVLNKQDNKKWKINECCEEKIFFMKIYKKILMNDVKNGCFLMKI